MIILEFLHAVVVLGMPVALLSDGLSAGVVNGMSIDCLELLYRDMTHSSFATTDLRTTLPGLDATHSADLTIRFTGAASQATRDGAPLWSSLIMNVQAVTVSVSVPAPSSMLYLATSRNVVYTS